MTELDKFLEERSKIPSGDVAWVKLLAKELALGVNRGLWERKILVGRSYSNIAELRSGDDNNLQLFIECRWGDRRKQHLLDLLEGYEYIAPTEGGCEIATAAFKLVDETEPYNIFISYKRSESSALALLVLARLKEHELVPFVDMALEAGGNWHADLEERIKENDYFIILLSDDTLASNMTVREIRWALEYEKTIIPLWHSGFDINDEKWNDVPTEVMDVIQQTNAIRVTDESASGYNTAIVELLNRFGITP